MFPHLKAKDSFLVRNNPRLARLLAEDRTDQDGFQGGNEDVPVAQQGGITPQRQQDQGSNMANNDPGRSTERNAVQDQVGSPNTRTGFSITGFGTVAEDITSRDQQPRGNRYHPYRPQPVRLFRQPVMSPVHRLIPSGYPPYCGHARFPTFPIRPTALAHRGVFPGHPPCGPKLNPRTIGNLPGISLGPVAEGFPHRCLYHGLLNREGFLGYGYRPPCMCCQQFAHRRNIGSIEGGTNPENRNVQAVRQAEERHRRNRDRRNAVFNETMANCALVPELAEELHLLWQYVRLLEGDMDELREGIRLIDEMCAKRFPNCLISTAKFHPNYTHLWYPIPEEVFNRKLELFYEEMKSQLRRRREQTLDNIVANAVETINTASNSVVVANQNGHLPPNPPDRRARAEVPNEMALASDHTMENVLARPAQDDGISNLPFLDLAHEGQELLAALGLSPVQSPQRQGWNRSLRPPIYSSITPSSVNPIYRGQGLGTQLLTQHFIDFLRSANNLLQGHGLGNIGMSNLPSSRPPLVPPCLAAMGRPHYDLRNNAALHTGHNSPIQVSCMRGHGQRPDFPQNQIPKGNTSPNRLAPFRISSRNQARTSRESPPLQPQQQEDEPLSVLTPLDQLQQRPILGSERTVEANPTSPLIVPKLRLPALDVTREWINSLPVTTAGSEEIDEGESTENLESEEEDNVEKKVLSNQQIEPSAPNATGAANPGPSRQSSKIMEIIVLPDMNNNTSQKIEPDLEKLGQSEEQRSTDDDENK